MIQIRNSIFETNSSSTHSIIICPEDDYEKFRSGEILITGYESGHKAGLFIDRSSAIHILHAKYEDNEPYFRDEYEIETFDECDDTLINEMLAREGIAYTIETYGEDYETYEEYYTTEHGDHIVVFGYFGNDW